MDNNNPREVADWLDSINHIEGSYATSIAADMIRKLAGVSKHTSIEEWQCPECGAKMVSRTNRQNGNKFWGCSKYPNCKGTRDENGLSKAERDAKREIREEQEFREAPYQPQDEMYRFRKG